PWRQHGQVRWRSSYRCRRSLRSRVRLYQRVFLCSYNFLSLLLSFLAPGPFQREFGRVSKVAVVIDDRDPRFIFSLFNGREEKVCFNDSVHNIFTRVGSARLSSVGNCPLPRLVRAPPSPAIARQRDFAIPLKERLRLPLRR